MTRGQDLTVHKDLVGSIRIDHYAYEQILDAITEALEDVCEDPLMACSAAVPSCQLIVGGTRTGKSTVATDVMARFAPARNREGVRQSIVYAAAPPKGTVKAILEQLLKALGDPHWARGSESNMTQRLLTLLRGVGCRMIIIDEFQHLSDKGQRRLLARTADWLKNLVEGKEWALVAIGLPEAISVINANPQLMARFDPPLVMPLFDWNDDQSRAQFKAILMSFVRELSPFELPDLGNHELALRMYLATSGRIGLFVKLMDRAVKTAIRKGDPRIRMEDLVVAFERSIWFAQDFPLPGGPFRGDISLCQNAALLTSVMHLAAHDSYADTSASVRVQLSGEGERRPKNANRKSEKRYVREELERAL